LAAAGWRRMPRTEVRRDKRRATERRGVACSPARGQPSDGARRLAPQAGHRRSPWTWFCWTCLAAAVAGMGHHLRAGPRRRARAASVAMGQPRDEAARPSRNTAILGVVLGLAVLCALCRARPSRGSRGRAERRLMHAQAALTPWERTGRISRSRDKIGLGGAGHPSGMATTGRVPAGRVIDERRVYPARR
jgi:hypothetical protein